jgi:hypothetical protein
MVAKKALSLKLLSWLTRNMDQRLQWNMRMTDGKKKRVGEEVIGRINPCDSLKTT